jgi:hypothetical protein
MLRDGLVELAASERDARARVVTASKLGQRRYAVAKAAVQKVEHAVRAQLGARAFAALESACLEAAGAFDAL